MVTLNGIIAKIGHDPYHYDYVMGRDFGGDDTTTWGPFDNLTAEELDFVHRYCIEEQKKEQMKLKMQIV